MLLKFNVRNVFTCFTYTIAFEICVMIHSVRISALAEEATKIWKSHLEKLKIFLMQKLDSYTQAHSQKIFLHGQCF